MKTTTRLSAVLAAAAIVAAPLARADDPPSPPAQICDGLDYIYGDQTGVTDPELIHEARQNVIDRAVIDAQHSSPTGWLLRRQAKLLSMPSNRHARNTPTPSQRYEEKASLQ